jgi:hypothetical protein
VDEEEKPWGWKESTWELEKEDDDKGEKERSGGGVERVREERGVPNREVFAAKGERES